MEIEDVLGDTIGLFDDEVAKDDTIHYGPLILTTAPKEGKAITLLSDHLFSPSLFLAERIERGLVPISGKTVVELGAGCALPSLLSATLADPPSLVVVTDYPDHTILDNLQHNVQRNQVHFSPQAAVHCVGYEWGKDVRPLLALSSTGSFDVVILSDLLHFETSHDVLLSCLASLLARSCTSRTYVVAGKYTRAEVCRDFLVEGEKLGLVWEVDDDEDVWRGTLAVGGGGLDREQLGVRKGMCKSWVGRWSDDGLLQSSAPTAEFG
ncbi:hypothetical protein BC835DRAFT_805071 [Cytidiella melzeri]|nr:hypothetical protein BC835DRAFT_805071 [Cytidiella melzeri]